MTDNNTNVSYREPGKKSSECVCSECFKKLKTKKMDITWLSEDYGHGNKRFFDKNDCIKWFAGSWWQMSVSVNGRNTNAMYLTPSNVFIEEFYDAYNNLCFQIREPEKAFEWFVATKTPISKFLLAEISYSQV